MLLFGAGNVRATASKKHIGILASRFTLSEAHRGCLKRSGELNWRQFSVESSGFSEAWSSVLGFCEHLEVGREIPSPHRVFPPLSRGPCHAAGGGSRAMLQ